MQQRKQSNNKSTQKGSKKGTLSGGGSPKMTKAETEILYLIIEEDLTPKQISIRRQTTNSITYRIIRNLKKKGLLVQGTKKVHFSGVASVPFREKGSGIRLHSEAFKIKILTKSEKYLKILKDCNYLYIDGNSVMLYKDSIVVYGNKSFFGDSVEKVTRDSSAYWERLIFRLENDFRIILIKPRYQNIKRFRSHYAEINNGLARECGDKSDFIRIYTREDGKLWFLIDNSFNLHEAETLHPNSAHVDMQDVVRPFFNDLREHYKDTGETITSSSVLKIVNDVAKNQLNISKNFDDYAENIKSHVEAIQLMSKKLGELSDMMKEVKKNV